MASAHLEPRLLKTPVMFPNRLRCSPSEAVPVGRARWPALLLTAALILTRPQVLRAEDRVDYRYEDYAEDNGRIQIQTHTAYVEAELTSRVAVKGQFVYDAISGATPTGGPPAPGDPQVPLLAPGILKDIRRAGSIITDLRYGAEPDGKHGRFVTSPQIAFSRENDYESIGVALNQTVNFNQRNTALALGLAHNFDRVRGFFQPDFVDKDTTDALLGFRQILSPRTVLTANLTFGYAQGYLSDPYKGVNFTYSYPISFWDPVAAGVNDAERRPDKRFRQVLFLELQHYVDKLRGALQVNWRGHHDDWGILASTAEITWHQKFGRRGRDMDPWFTLSPFFRFHHQTAADFYAVRFVGDPGYSGGAQAGAQSDGFTILFSDDPAFPGDATSILTVPAYPSAYSSDYRLSRLNTFSFGLSMEIRLHDRFSLYGGYKRYVMEGLDGVTSDSAYPTAHVVTVGATLWF